MSQAFDDRGAKATQCLDGEITDGGMFGEDQGRVEDSNLGGGMRLERPLVGGASKERGGVRTSRWRGELEWFYGKR